jgi:ATP-dependent RNA helicase DeaD
LLESTPLTTFDTFKISPNSLSSIKEMGFTEASEIQEKAIPHLLEGKDLIGQAQTGTGKTAAFAIPGIERINAQSKDTQMLILCPTRELVVQVEGELRKLSKNHPEIYSLAIYGGQDISIQLKALKRGANIVVGTPGRIIDHIKRKTLKLKDISYLVFDEADQMLDMGFREDMETILTETPKSRQTVMFSATMNKVLIALMKKFQNDPVHINTVGEQKQSQQINQIYFHINRSSKLEAVKRLIAFHKITNGLIFCNTKVMVDDLAKTLTDARYSTACLHGDIDQKKRDRVMKEFRAGNIDFLVATDVAARGLDINDLEAVINYDIPRFDQDYTHRIGRTGRGGKVGLALTLVVDSEVNHIERIARKNNMTIAAGKIPEREDLEANSVDTVKVLIENADVKRKDLDKYIGILNQLEMYQYKGDELAAVILKTLMEQSSQTFDNVDFSPSKRSRSGDRDRGEGRERGSGGGSGGGGRSSSAPRGRNRSDFKHKAKSNSSKRPKKYGFDKSSSSR